MPDFQERPNLAGVITTDDVSTKGSGNFKADYVNWARIAHLLHLKAPGWEFHLRLSPEQQHVWRAPNGTGYVVGYFTGPGDAITPDFPQSVMDNRNAPVQFEKISARDVTDTHRRCLCTAAAYTFGLAYELWAKEEVENPYREESEAGASTTGSKKSTTQSSPAPKPAAGETHADLLKKLESFGITPYGMKTFTKICEIEKIEQIAQEKIGRLINALTAERVANFNDGKNSKGETILPPPVKNKVGANSSIDELTKAAEEAFGDD
jgi:hypothetical protein